jgi:hypothetical protein
MKSTLRFVRFRHAAAFVLGCAAALIALGMVWLIAVFPGSETPDRPLIGTPLLTPPALHCLILQ